MTVIKLVKENQFLLLSQTSDHEVRGTEHVSDNTRSRATMTSPTPSSPNSESFKSNMDELTLSMGKSRLSDETSPPCTIPIDPRIKSNGQYSCQGYTVESKLCDRDGIDVVKFKKDFGRYCFQHNPEKEDQKCHAYNRNGIDRCANTCSINAGEVREDSRPICNTHHKLGAKLIDGSHYPAHPRLNKKK
ncbi:MAG: hypothetical protein J3R72DRAFT_129914 [Linnemannia gamsii]|nr:MAG: hypothetical protein J3R72DRAFT_129914 [Linnemannia gamsii]